MKILGIVPARFKSQRLEGKPLLDLCGKTMIQRVYEQASKALEHVIVATDDQRIFDHVASFGGRVSMTSPNHNTGSNRCLEVLEQLEANGESYDLVINIQGDEPLLAPEQLKELADCFDDNDVKLATLAKATEKGDSIGINQGVYLTRDNNGNALYFSRFPIPFLRDLPMNEWTNAQVFLKHVGIYAYKPDALKVFAKSKQTSLEKCESLEQLRWLEQGFKIRVGVTEHETIGVDTPEDAEKVIALLRTEK